MDLALRAMDYKSSAITPSLTLQKHYELNNHLLKILFPQFLRIHL
jgi:hypothetical protein